MERRLTKKSYIDLLKLMAAFLVIYNHLPGYTLYYVSDGVQQWGYMALTMLTRANVPLFLMISGALLLPRIENYKELFFRRVLRYIIVIIAANTLIYTIWHMESFSVMNLLVGILKGSIQGSYWYLYCYLGFLIMLPFLRKLARDFTKMDFIYLLIFHFVIASLLPIVQYVFARKWGISISLASDFQIPLFTIRAIFYPLAGHYLANVANVEMWRRRRIAIIAGVGVLGIIVSMCMTYIQGIDTGFSQKYVQLFDYLTAICCFIIVRYLFEKCVITEKWQKILRNCAAVTFGIYLFDPVLKKYIYSPVQALLDPYLPTIFVSFSWCVISMIICGLVTWILRKNKIVSKFL